MTLSKNTSLQNNIRMNAILRFCLIGIALGTIALICCFPVQSEDLFMYLAIGREFFTHNLSLPLRDPFLNSKLVHNWNIYPEWASYIASYAFYLMGGFTLIILAKTLLITSAFAFPLFFFNEKMNWVVDLIWACGAIASIFGAASRLSERSSLTSDFFTVLTLCILLKQKLRPGKLFWFLPLVFVPWVNLHPGFPLGLSLIGIFILSEFLLNGWKRSRIYILSLALAIIACMLNPKGSSGFIYPITFAMTDGPFVTATFYEWMSPFKFPWNSNFLYIFIIMAIDIALLFYTMRSKPYFEIMVFLVSVLMTISAYRFILVATLMLFSIMIFLSVRAFDLELNPPKDSIKWKALIFCFLYIIGVDAHLLFEGYQPYGPHRNLGFGIDHKIFPVGVVQFMQKNRIDSLVFNSHFFGGYLSWAWGDRGRLFFHGFIIDQPYFLEYFQAMDSVERFERTLASYGFTSILLDKHGGSGRFLRFLSGYDKWKLAYEDEAGYLFLKK
jgi:hypothetical protein